MPSPSRPHSRRGTSRVNHFEELKSLNIEEKLVMTSDIDQDQKNEPSWMDPTLAYLRHGALLEQRAEAKAIVT